MANRLHILRQRLILAASSVLLSCVGCAFPNGTTGGDPILGNFNRPIVPTPPPERGGLGLDSPAYDGGARIGMMSPDIPTPTHDYSGINSLPGPMSGGVFNGLRTPFGTPSDAAAQRRSSSATGAKLPGLAEAGPRVSPVSYRYAPDGVISRPVDAVSSITSATSFTPAEPLSPIKTVSHVETYDSAKIKSFDDGNTMLRDLGASGLRTEQLRNGDWMLYCTVGSKHYECRGESQTEAVRKVLEQINKK